MGDWLRRLLYPLVLPTIVATVWLCGWVRQQDDRNMRGRRDLSTQVIEVYTIRRDPPAFPDGPVSAPRRDSMFSAASLDDAAGEP